MSENNTKKSEWRERELGALWIKQGSSKNYMTGNFLSNGERIPVVVFKNTNKTSDNAPDYIIYKSKPRQEVSLDEQPTVMHSDNSEEVPELLA